MSFFPTGLQKESSENKSERIPLPGLLLGRGAAFYAGMFCLNSLPSQLAQCKHSAQLWTRKKRRGVVLYINFLIMTKVALPTGVRRNKESATCEHSGLFKVA